MVSPDSCYHEGMRGLQDRFDARRLADRLAETLSRERFTDEDRAFVEARTMFFLATADAAGAPDCSYKGGDPGFVRVLDDTHAGVPVATTATACSEPRQHAASTRTWACCSSTSSARGACASTARRLAEDDPLRRVPRRAARGARARARIFPNCPRYIHRQAKS